MAVREFDGTDDELQTATGALDALTYGTLAVLVERLSIDSTHTVVAPHTSGGTGNGLRTEWTQFNDIALRDSAGGTSNVGSQGTANIWRLLVWRKDTGDVTPRVSIYDYDTASWQHSNGHATLDDGGAPGVDGTIRFGIGQFGGRGHYRIAAAAYWSNEVHWSADSTGDSAIVSSGLKDAYQSWLDESPDGAWKFDQDSVSTAVVDDTGNGADETSLTGTTVITGDDPPGFDFSLGITATVGQVTETDTARAITTGAQTIAVGQATSTSSAQPISAVETTLLGRPAETDTAQPIGAVETTTVGQAATASTAQPITTSGETTVIVGQAASTATAGSVGSAKAAAIGQTAEAGAAQAITVVSTTAVGQASSTDTALTVSSSASESIGQVSSTGSALAVSPVRAYALAQAAGTDSALALSTLKTATIGQVSETGSARPVTSSGGAVAVTPAIRTHVVASEDRSSIVSAESRTRTIASESRTVAV